MDRRSFLKKSVMGGILVSSPSILLANEDYSIKANPGSEKYKYNPFAGSRSIQDVRQQETSQIQNNILPQNSNLGFWDMPRQVYLHRRQSNENARIVYFDQGKINEQGYRLACYLLRDVIASQVIAMDLRLLDLVCAVQAWLKYYGFNGPVLVNSGYRTARTNGSLEGAAKNSMHLYGRAIDFTVPGLTPAALAQIAAQFRAGGIGIYPNQNFIHLDTGGVRVWVKR